MGYHLSIFREKWYKKGSGVGPQGRASPYKTLLSAPRGRGTSSVLALAIKPGSVSGRDDGDYDLFRGPT